MKIGHIFKIQKAVVRLADQLPPKQRPSPRADAGTRGTAVERTRAEQTWIRTSASPHLSRSSTPQRGSSKGQP